MTLRISFFGCAGDSGATRNRAYGELEFITLRTTGTCRFAPKGADGRSHRTGHPPLVSSLVLQRSSPEFEFVTLDLASSEALFEDVEGRVAP
jgi:hypothetical protein